MTHSLSRIAGPGGGNYTDEGREGIRQVEDDVVAVDLDGIVDLGEVFHVGGASLTEEVGVPDPVRAAVGINNHVALEGVLHVFRGQLVSVVKGDAVADPETVGRTVFADAAVLPSGNLGCERGDELVGGLAIEINERLVDIGHDFPRRRVVGLRRVEAVRVADSTVHVGVRVLDLGGCLLFRLFGCLFFRGTAATEE